MFPGGGKKNSPPTFKKNSHILFKLTHPRSSEDLFIKSSDGLGCVFCCKDVRSANIEY